MEEFTDKQNVVFRKLFGELKKMKPLYDVKANTIIDLDDENFTKLYTDDDCTITGETEALKLVAARALYLGLTRT